MFSGSKTRIRTDAVKEIILVAPGADSGPVGPFVDQLREMFVPNRIVMVISDAGREDHAALVPLVRDKVARGGKTTAYVCERRVCELPTADPRVFARQVAKVQSLGDK